MKNKPEALLPATPKGSVPVLLLNESNASSDILEESMDIMTWALSCSDPDGWLVEDENTRDQIDDLIQQNDGPFKEALDGYKYADRDNPAAKLEHRNNAESYLNDLNARLASSCQPYLCGDRLCLADVALLPFIRQFANVDPAWFAQTPYTNLQHWLGHGVSQPLFLDVMHKYAPWQPGDKVTIFDPNGRSN